LHATYFKKINKQCNHPSTYTKQLEKSTESSTETGIPDTQYMTGKFVKLNSSSFNRTVHAAEVV